MSVSAAPVQTEKPVLIERWRAAWPAALAVWSKYTRLHDARLCTSRLQASQEGLSGSFAMIRLVDQSVVIDLETVRDLHLEDYGVEVLAHEIGHHVLAPGNVTDQFRLLARIRRALPTLERHAPMVANLYTDLFINDRLQRQAGLRMADIYRQLANAAGQPNAADAAHTSGVWALYLRIYENLWRLDAGSLGSGDAKSLAKRFERLETDAWLGARLIRVYANDWMRGAGSFATLLLAYLVEDQDALGPLRYLQDTRHAAQGSAPSGGVGIEPDELGNAVHPCEAPLVTGEGETAQASPAQNAKTGPGQGQARDPFEYGEILKAAGVALSDHDMAVRYYRERALPYLVPFPTRVNPESPEPQMEGLEPWDIGDALDDLDWLQSSMVSPRPIPGLTTVRRVYGFEPAREQDRIPVDLDMYVDSSGSMPNPQVNISYMALAGAVIALSALRAGSRVQVTLWSGKNQFMHTKGFVRDENDILRVLTGFYGGATCFPVHRLRDTFAARTSQDRPVHILQISDDGISTLFDNDERGQSGWDITAHALAVGRAGGTMALNLPANWASANNRWQSFDAIKRAQTEQGWDIHAVVQLEDLMAFARAFSQRHYQQGAAPVAGAHP